jgi:hypothetical protein
MKLPLFTSGTYGSEEEDFKRLRKLIFEDYGLSLTLK